ncbi:hypothetical protein HN011_012076 [Eciton burchellii]|nr:hypothetical protein HN011_012076 [Eciton burchellii]
MPRRHKDVADKGRGEGKLRGVAGTENNSEIRGTKISRLRRATEGGDKGCEAGEGRKGGFVRPSGINGRENECHLFRNTHPENHGAGEKFTEKATLKKGDEIP